MTRIKPYQYYTISIFDTVLYLICFAILFLKYRQQKFDFHVTTAYILNRSMNRTFYEQNNCFLIKIDKMHLLQVGRMFFIYPNGSKLLSIGSIGVVKMEQNRILRVRWVFSDLNRSKLPSMARNTPILIIEGMRMMGVFCTKWIKTTFF